jgi:hypothetical protein
MTRSVAERYAVGAFAFMAAATWLGVGLTHGLMCLFVALLGSQATRIYQRRHDARTRSTAQRSQRTRRPPAQERRQRSDVYDAGAEDYDRRAVADAAW